MGFSRVPAGDGSGRDGLTPPELARRYGVNVGKVLGWVHSGELNALNLASRLGGRPRYFIRRQDLEDFETRRSTQAGSLACLNAPRRPRQTNPPCRKQYY
jgi:hypothetical protein